MKKLFALIFVFVFCLSFASAFEFDNVKDYNSIKKEVTIKNCDIWFLICLNEGDEIAKVKLNTPLDNHVPISKEKIKVAEMEFKPFQDYNNALKELELFDKRNNNKKFERDFDYKVRSYETIIVDDYETVCEFPEKDYYRNCEQILIGTHEEQKEKWTKLKRSDFKKNEVLTIGIFTEVKKRDVIEWIPNLFGVRVEEWATWTEDLNVGLRMYYNFDEGTGSNMEEKILGQFNLTFDVSDSWSNGILGNAIDVAGANYASTSSGIIPQWEAGLNQDWTINFWLNRTDASGNQWMIDAGEGSNGWIVGNENSNKIYVVGAATGNLQMTTSDVPLQNWTMITLVYDESASTFKGYFNGILEFNRSVNFDINDANQVKRIGANEAGGTPYKGTLDELGKWNITLDDGGCVIGAVCGGVVGQLFNDGLAITYTDVFNELNVTLNPPIDGFNSSSQNIEFNCSATDEIGVLNLSLIIDDIFNFTITNSSSGENLSLVQTINSISEGNHNWTCAGCDDGSCDTPSARDFFIDSINPSVIINNPLNQILASSEVIFNITGSVDIESCLGTITGGASNFTMTNISSEWTFTNSSVPDGSYTFNPSCNDSLNNINDSESTSFSIDTIFPILEIIYPVNNSVFDFNSIDINISIVEASPETCIWSNDSFTTNQTINCGNNITEIWDQGINVVNFWMNDTAGNNNETSVTFSVDSIGPQVEFIFPTNNSNHTNAQVTLNISIIEASPETCLWSNNSFVTNNSITCGDNITEIWDQGTNVVNFWMNDTVGNDNQTSISFFIDSINPDVNVILPLNKTHSISTIEFKINATDTNLDNCSMSLDGAPNISLVQSGINWSFTNATMTEGSHSVQYYCFDNFGNVNDSEIVNFGILIPTVNLISPVDNFESDNFDVEFNCNFSLAGIKNVSILTNASGQLTPNQTTTISGRYGDEYYLVIEADALDETAVEVNDVTVTQVQSNVWKVNSTSTDNNLSRAKVLGTLYYGVADGSSNDRNPRIFNITNISSIISNNIIDANTNIYMISTNGSGGPNAQYKQNITFTNPSGNYISSWSNLNSGDSQNSVWWIIPATSSTSCPSGNFNCGQASWSSEIGTDTSQNETNASSSTISGYTGDDPGGQELQGRLLLMVKDGTAQNSTVDLSIMSNYEIEFIDFQNDYNIPKIIYEDTQDFINEFWNTTTTEPTLWSCQACDIDDDCFLADENRTVLLNETGPVINLNEPSGVIDSFIIGNNLTINWTVSDTNLDECWFEYNNINTSVTCAANNYSFITILSKQNLTFYANDTLGNENSNFTSWTYKVLENNVTFNDITTEGATETFTINFTKPNDVQISSIDLIYNGTNYSSLFRTSGNEVIGTNTITIPNQNEPSVVGFFFSILTSDSDRINTTENSQTINILNFDNCSSFGNVIYNFTVFEEETQVKLANTTIEVQFNMYDSSKENLILNFSQIYNNENPASICANNSLFNTINYSADVVVKYSANETSGNSSTEYAIEYYNILNQIITNSTIPMEINLYDLKLDDATDFQLTFRDSSLILAPDVLVEVYRQYVSDNDFKIVEIPVTDSNGQTILHLVRNDIIYNFIMKDSAGNILATYNKIIAFCQDFTIGSCEIILNAEGEVEQFFDYADKIGISYTTTYSNVTKLLSFSFISNDGSPKKINIDVTRGGSFGNRTVCKEELTSASGTIICNASSVAATDIYLYLDISADDELGASDIINLEAKDFDWGVNGSLFAFLLILAFMLMFSEDKQLLVVGIMFGWIISVSMAFISGKVVGVGAASLWLVVTGIIIIWKLKKEEFG